MSAPRLEINLSAISGNTRLLVDLLTPLGISVTGIAKAACGLPAVAEAIVRGGASGVGDSRVENLAQFRDAGIATPLTLIRSPMLSQVERTVRISDTSLNTDATVIDALSVAALRHGTRHGIVLMVELGDLREGISADEVVNVARTVERLDGLELVGLGTNHMCHSGVIPDQRNMDALSGLADAVEDTIGRTLAVVSGGNSANLEWALNTHSVGRINDLRIGEAILLGTDPLRRNTIEGLRTDAFTLFGEVIEASIKPAQPWGEISGVVGSHRAASRGNTPVRQVLIALGTQDTDFSGLTPPEGVRLLGMSSDHLIADIGDHDISVGDELAFGLDYDALVRSATSPFVATQFVGE